MKVLALAALCIDGMSHMKSHQLTGPSFQVQAFVAPLRSAAPPSADPNGLPQRVPGHPKVSKTGAPNWSLPPPRIAGKHGLVPHAGGMLSTVEYLQLVHELCRPLPRPNRVLHPFPHLGCPPTTAATLNPKPKPKTYEAVVWRLLFTLLASTEPSRPELSLEAFLDVRV